MGDRTWGQLTVVQLDTKKYPEEAAAILAAIVETGLAFQGVEPDGDPFSVLQTGPDAQYGDDQVSCGFVGSYLAPLAVTAPHAVFWGSESPAYEWLGEVIQYHPHLGVWRHACDNDGYPVFTLVEVLNLIKLSKTAPEPRINYLLGIPWDDKIEELSARLRAEQQEASNG